MRFRSRQKFLDALCDLLTTNDGTRHGHDWWYWGSGTRWSDAGVEAEQAQLESAIEALFDALDPASLDFGVERDRTAAYYILALARVFDDVLEAYSTAKERQNVLDYDDLVETAIGFLEDAPAIREQLREEFAFVMVDEVQDTNPRQWDLVQLLTSEDAETYDGDNVFLVGDEKQSIYRFRGADVTSFAEARAALTDANPDGVETIGSSAVTSEPPTRRSHSVTTSSRTSWRRSTAKRTSRSRRSHRLSHPSAPMGGVSRGNASICWYPTRTVLYSTDRTTSTRHHGLASRAIAKHMLSQLVSPGCSLTRQQSMTKTRMSTVGHDQKTSRFFSALGPG